RDLGRRLHPRRRPPPGGPGCHRPHRRLPLALHHRPRPRTPSRQAHPPPPLRRHHPHQALANPPPGRNPSSISAHIAHACPTADAPRMHERGVVHQRRCTTPHSYPSRPSPCPELSHLLPHASPASPTHL